MHIPLSESSVLCFYLLWQPHLWHFYRLLLLYSFYYLLLILDMGCPVLLSDTSSITRPRRGEMRSEVKLPCTFVHMRTKMAGLWWLQKSKCLQQIFSFLTSNGFKTPTAHGLPSKPSKSHHNFFFPPLPPSFHHFSVHYFLGCQECWMAFWWLKPENQQGFQEKKAPAH